MGNCMETYTMRQQEEAEEKHKQEDEERGKSSEFLKINEKNNGLRVKVVLTKEELKWLMLQLNEKGGNKKLEQVLREIERGREIKVEGSWKPSLESILEVPEIVEMDR